MIWTVVNALLSLAVSGIITYKLGWLGYRFTCMERIGMGLLGTGALLTIGPILWHDATPFEDWSVSLLRLGCLIYLFGRLLKHHHANQEMVRAARRHKARRAPPAS